MVDENIENKPDFVGDGVDVWVNASIDGRKYLAIKLLGRNFQKCTNFFPVDLTIFRAA